MKKAVVIGTGMNLPKNKVTNQDLEKIVDTTDEWIITRTGIKTRYMAEEGLTLTDLSVPACEQALKNANLKPEDIDLIIYSTYTPDYQIPSNACILQHKLGCTRAAAFDVEAACSGYVYGSTIASQFIATGMYKHVCSRRRFHFKVFRFRRQKLLCFVWRRRRRNYFWRFRR